METFGIIILIIALIIIGKFVYDSYLTNNTDRKFEEYRKKNPIDAAEIERPKTIIQHNDLVDAISNEVVNNDKNRGNKILAEELSCDINDIRKVFFKSLKEQKYSSYQIHCFVSQFEKEIEEQSQKYNLQQRHTPAFILKNLTEEYIQISQDDYYAITSKKLSSMGKSIDEIQSIIKRQIEDYPDNDKIHRDFLLRDQPAELLRLKAIDQLYDHNNYNGALMLVDKALALNDQTAKNNLDALKIEILAKIQVAETGNQAK